MYATDFIYDGEYLSDYHFVICSIDNNSSIREISAGSEITFNQLSINNGSKHSLISTQYNSCISANFDICKDPDYFNDIEIKESEHYKIMRWLNRNEFKKFNFRTNYTRRCNYNASFNITNIYIDDKLVGFRLSMVTDKPYGTGEEVKIDFNSDSPFTCEVYNESDEIGYLYPTLNITPKTNGDMVITNKTYNIEYPTIVKNCTAGENIIIDCENQVITSTKPDHICDDFNFRFFALGSSYKNFKNEISISLPCKFSIAYKPIIKNIN